MGGTFRARSLVTTSLLLTSVAACEAPAPPSDAPTTSPTRPEQVPVDAIAISRATERHAPASFVARPRGATVFFADDAIGLALQREGGVQNLRWTPRGGRIAAPHARGERPSRTTRLAAVPEPAGSDWSEVVYDELWDGIDLVASGASQSWAYRFEIEGGRDANRIDLEWDGAERLTVDADGRGLTIATASGEVRESGLRCYEIEPAAGGGEAQRDVACRFRASGTRYGFDVERVDRSARLVIDPVIDWGTYVGGGAMEQIHAVTTDAAGDVYLGGATFSLDFPIEGGFDDTHSGNGQVDGVIMKVDRTGALLWSSFLGGAFLDNVRAIAVDADGSVVVVGETESDDFPLVDPIDDFRDLGYEPFITKIAPDGGSIVFSTFYGGRGHDSFGTVAIDGGGAIHAGGYGGATFPVVNPFDPDPGIFNEGVIVKLSADGQTVHYASCFGGPYDDEIAGIALDPAGNAYLGGRNQLGFDFPISGGFDLTPNGAVDAYVAKVDSDGALLWTTYVGGLNNDIPKGLVVDAAGNATLAGTTGSADLPVQGGSDATLSGGGDGFVTQVSTDGALVWSTYLGGSLSTDAIHAIGIDPPGDVYVVGETTSTDFPTTDDAFQPTFGGTSDGFVTRLAAADGTTVWSSYLGGGSGEQADGVAASGADEVYVVGITSSIDFPVKDGFDMVPSGGDGFLVRLDVFRSNGSACATAEECESGICEDGICCAVACGLCSSCDASGTTCNVVPPDDSACGTISCDGLDTTCADFTPITTARCEAANDCKDADSADCVAFVPVAGACDDGDACTENDACTAGTCEGDVILGCGEGGAGGGTGGAGSGEAGGAGTGGAGGDGVGGQGTGGAGTGGAGTGGTGTGGAGTGGTGGAGTGGAGTGGSGTGGSTTSGTGGDGGEGPAGSGGEAAVGSTAATTTGSASTAAGPATSAASSTAGTSSGGGDDAGAIAAEGDGCDCRATGARSSGNAAPLALLALAAIAARRRRAR